VKAPTGAELSALAGRIASRVSRILERQGLLVGFPSQPEVPASRVPSWVTFTPSDREPERQTVILGPRQIAARINQEQVIAPQITPWNQQARK
jgi:poly(3-hydroxybutyrate) depolymerase